VNSIRPKPSRKYAHKIKKPRSTHRTATENVVVIARFWFHLGHRGARVFQPSTPASKRRWCMQRDLVDYVTERTQSTLRGATDNEIRRQRLLQKRSARCRRSSRISVRRGRFPIKSGTSQWSAGIKRFGIENESFLRKRFANYLRLRRRFATAVTTSCDRPCRE